MLSIDQKAKLSGWIQRKHDHLEETELREIADFLVQLGQEDNVEAVDEFFRNLAGCKLQEELLNRTRGTALRGELLKLLQARANERRSKLHDRQVFVSQLRPNKPDA